VSASRGGYESAGSEEIAAFCRAAEDDGSDKEKSFATAKSARGLRALMPRGDALMLPRLPSLLLIAVAHVCCFSPFFRVSPLSAAPPMGCRRALPPR